MPKIPPKSFDCTVIGKTVRVGLRRRAVGAGHGKLFVHCSERTCPYVDANEPPCPLTLAVFATEIEACMAEGSAG